MVILFMKSPEVSFDRCFMLFNNSPLLEASIFGVNSLMSPALNSSHVLGALLDRVWTQNQLAAGDAGIKARIAWFSNTGTDGVIYEILGPTGETLGTLGLPEFEALMRAQDEPIQPIVPG